MATKTINDLYLKYTNKVGRTLESDRYFQYLYEMVQAGENTFRQNNQILHKVVDERWLSTIEESLDAINTIIEKPRRFVTTTEEVVPVALAKKITADSVRHLSMNTQFIASSEDGDIQPTRVLNVSTEESYDLYENRFVYHLIQRLVTFIDKRTDVIFWATGDEKQNVLCYESKVDDAYEEIEYKIEMKVKNRQSFAENDADNMNVFMRIDRVRRMVMALKHSSFCDLMAGCSKVRSPIQRTNLIMKDPNYRTCYKLWQFLENYDEVGYTIEVENQALQFDEEYMIQMYTNLITNYTVFKSLLEADTRDPDELLAKKRRVIKPKFIKKIKEEIVDDCNLEDVEIRQVFIQEVTQAQLEAEAKLEEEIKNRKAAEEALEEMDSQMIFYQQQVSQLMMQNQETEIRAEEERQEKEKLMAELEETKAQAESQVAEARAEAESLIAETKAQAESQVAQARAQAESKIAENNRENEEKIARIIQQSQSEIETTKACAEAQIAETSRLAEEKIAETNRVVEEKITETNRAAEERIAETTKKSRDEIDEIKARAAEQMAQVKEEAESRITEAKTQAEAQMAEAKAQAEAQVAEAKAQAENLVTETKTQAEAQIVQVSQAAEKKIAQTDREAKEEINRLQLQTKELVEEIRSSKDEELAAQKAAMEEQFAVRSTYMEEQFTAQKDQLGQEIQKLLKMKAELEHELSEARQKELLLVNQLSESRQETADARKATDDARAQIEISRKEAEYAKKQTEAAKQEIQSRDQKIEAAREEARLAREEAERQRERADANTLSHMIVSAWNGRKQRNDKDGGNL